MYDCSTLFGRNALLTLSIPSNYQWVVSFSPSNIGPKRSKIWVWQEKPNKSAHILTVDIAVLPSLSDTVHSPPRQFIQNQALIHRLSHQLYAHCHHPWKVYIQCFRKLIFLWLAIVLSLIWTSTEHNRKWQSSSFWNWFQFGCVFRDNDSRVCGMWALFRRWCEHNREGTRARFLSRECTKSLLH